MKLLFDANLSPKLVRRLAELFPGSAHVFDAGLGQSTSDQLIWDHAARNDFTIVTADSDFLALSRDLGSPPRVIRIEQCTFRTAQVEELIRRNALRISEFARSERPLLVLRRA